MGLKPVDGSGVGRLSLASAEGDGTGVSVAVTCGRSVGSVSDHRINLTLYRINEVMNGDLDEIIDALIMEDQSRKLAAQLAGE